MMKNLILWTTILCSSIFSNSVSAFHDGGDAHCDGCYSMHNGSGNTNLKDA
ncbi:MAG: hypothetical protein AB7F21_10580 [Desulfuromonadales bacterium]